LPSKEVLDGLLDAQLATLATSVATSAELQARRAALVVEIDKLIGAEEKVQTGATDAIEQMLESKEARECAFPKDSRTLKLAHGEISLRASTKLVIDNDETAFAWLREHHMFKRFTRTKDPEIDKPKLTKAPKIIEMIPGARLVTEDNMNIDVPGLSKPLSRLLGSLKRKLPAKS